MKKNFFLNFFSFIKKKKKIILENKNNVIKSNKQPNHILNKNILNESNILSKKTSNNSVIDVSQKSSCDFSNYKLNQVKIENKRNYEKINVGENLSKLKNNDISYKSNFIEKLRIQLKKTRDYLGLEIKNIFSKNEVDMILFDKLEEKLLSSDIGVKTTNFIISELKSEVVDNNINNTEAVYDLLKIHMLKMLSKVEKTINLEGFCFPFIILIVGVNGVGKTTTIGKLAAKYKKMGKSVMLAAGDTFRAAAIEQLQEWGLKNNVSVIAQHINADPAAVVFDAIKSAQAKKIDILIIDTAGRLHNNVHLMNELKKIKKVVKKIDILSPHETILVIDACSGQNTVQQTKLFHESLNLTGIVITKLDGTAKGGIIFPIANKFSIPIYYIGIGEKVNDLKVFDSKKFIESIF